MCMHLHTQVQSFEEFLSLSSFFRSLHVAAMQSCSSTFAFLLLAALLPRTVMFDSAIAACILASCLHVLRLLRQPASGALERRCLLYFRARHYFQARTRSRVQILTPIQRRIVASRYKALRRSINARARKRCMVSATASRYWGKLFLGNRK